MAPMAQDASDLVRQRLNEINGIDLQGNDRRLSAQVWAFFIGSIFESINDYQAQRIGKTLRSGAEKSFADYAGEKVSQWIARLLAGN